MHNQMTKSSEKQCINRQNGGREPKKEDGGPTLAI